MYDKFLNSIDCFAAILIFIIQCCFIVLVLCLAPIVFKLLLLIYLILQIMWRFDSDRL